MVGGRGKKKMQGTTKGMMKEFVEDSRRMTGMGLEGMGNPRPDDG